MAALNHPAAIPLPKYWPRPSPCARPQALVRGRPGAEVTLVVEHRGGRKHLPVVALRCAA